MPTFVFDHVGLSVADLDAQRRFYGDALGLTAVEETVDVPEAHVRSVILRAEDGLKIELIERGGSAPQEFTDPLDGAGTQGYFHWAVYVDDLDAAFDRLLRAGGRAVSAPAAAARPGMRFAYVKDPEGNLLELIKPATNHADDR
ncbi:Catechol 2,3-dioxygenase [Asanoa hainanensis]|uniref:Catechol 2,3-dioxygenase n=1 Tax=Asanoa hainanensis TaxID=560556 RepID=A0A239NVS5_9ACTN|nr:VOC family protein [Asanoa hainanensis]SNT58543.1 Catechol 2,3-dioxygenase [Asanoa hainanensis]